MRTCYFCGRPNAEAFCFCRNCMKEHGLWGKSPREWPKHYRLLKNMLDLERYHDIQFSKFIVDSAAEEEYAWLNEDTYQEFIIERANPELDLDEVLEAYAITEAEYELMTGNLKELAEKLGINYKAVAGRRYTLKAKLKARLTEPV